MQLLTVRVEGVERVAARRADGRLVDLTAAGVAATMLELIRAGDGVLARAAQALRDATVPLLPAEAAVLAPLPRPPRNVFCVGKNYREHAKEFGRSGFDGGAKGGDEVPDEPIVFSKPPSSVIGPGAPIPSASDPFGTVDYEGELAVVLGTGGRRIAEASALDHVFGYTIVNDVTARELQKRHKQWLLGKGPDGFCPMGPAIVTRDEVGSVDELWLETRVNGERRQRACVADLIFRVPALIATISAVITLEPGDVIATGTPAGVGIGYSPPRYLVPGDVVAVSIDRLGTLENPVA